MTTYEDVYEAVTPETDIEFKIAGMIENNSYSAWVEEISIPYALDEEIVFNKNGLPSRDIALLHLAGDGVPLKPHQFPLVNFDYAAIAESISFAGFGWTNVDHTFYLDGQDWGRLRLSAK